MTTTVTIAGMQTEHCKRAVFTALTAVPGITSADVTMGRVTIEHDGSATIQQLRDAIAVAGYTVLDVHEDRRTLTVLSQMLSRAESDENKEERHHG